MDIADKRRSALRSLIQEKTGGNATQFGTLIGRQQSYVSDLLSGRKSFGEKVARDIESKIHMPPGWLDRNADGNAQQAVLDVDVMEALLLRIRSCQLEHDVPVSRRQLALFIVIAYPVMKAKKSLSDAEIERILREMVESHGQ